MIKGSTLPILRVMRKYMYTQVALVSGQLRELSLQELFSSWPLGEGGGGGKGLDGRLLDLAQLQINIGNVKKKKQKKILLLFGYNVVLTMF